MLELAAERVSLRLLSPGEVSDLGGDPADFARRRGLASADGWPAPEVCRRFAEGFPGMERDPRFGVWVVVAVPEATLIGDVGFHGPPDEDGRAEIGYAIAPGWRGRGYATEAVARLCDWALALDEVRELAARTRPDNAPSAAVLDRLGFARVGPAGEYDLWVRAREGAPD